MTTCNLKQGGGKMPLKAKKVLTQLLSGEKAKKSVLRKRDEAAKEYKTTPPRGQAARNLNREMLSECVQKKAKKDALPVGSPPPNVATSNPSVTPASAPAASVLGGKLLGTASCATATSSSTSKAPGKVVLSSLESKAAEWLPVQNKRRRPLKEGAPHTTKKAKTNSGKK